MSATEVVSDEALRAVLGMVLGAIGYRLWDEVQGRRQSPEERIIVALWAVSKNEPEWTYGLDVMRIARLRSGRFYPAIDGLEKVGLVEAKWDETEPERKYRRRMYRVVRQEARS